MKIVEFISKEEGPASKALCRSKKPDSALGASQLASCKSQGLRKRSGKKIIQSRQKKSLRCRKKD